MTAEAGSLSERERRLHQVVAAWLEAAAAGTALTPEQMQLRYPEFTAELAEFFAGRDFLERLAAPLREVVVRPGAGPEGLPQQLGEYRLLREVGRGGMAVVYEAVQESLGRHVALKVLPTHALLAAEHRERFRREARAAALLHHSNIVPVFGVGQDRGVHFYAMQFIHGQSLDRVLRELRRARGDAAVTAAGEQTPAPGQPDLAADLSASLAEGLRAGQFPAGAVGVAGMPAPTSPNPGEPTERVGAGDDTPRSGLAGSREGEYFRGAARIGVQVAEALAYAHRQGILHRDIKPSNLLLDAQGTVWVTDFGLAKAEGSDELTRSGDVVGTLRYLAPERFDGRSDPRSDVYSLGATLYELLTLRPAFDEPDRAHLIERVTHGEPPRPRQVEGRIPRDLETIVLKAMAREPAARYQNAEALAEDLQRFLLDRPIRARRAGPAERAWRWCRRNPVVAGLLTTAVVLAAGLAVLALLLWDRQRQTAAALEAEAAQNQRAQENLKLALQAMDEVFLKPVEEEVSRKERQRQLPLPPQELHRLDRNVLQKGLDFYERFTQANSTDTSLRAETGKAYQRVGALRMALGEHAGAETALRQSMAILEGLAEEYPAVPEYRRTLANDYHWLGNVLRVTGRHREAEELLRKDVAVTEHLVAESPAEADYRDHLYHAFRALSELLKEEGRFAETEEPGYRALDAAVQLLGLLPDELLTDAPYRRALDVARRVRADSPGVLDDRHNQVLKLAHLLKVTGRPGEAEEVLRRSVTIAEQLVAASGTVAENRGYLCDAYRALGDLLREERRRPEAERVYRRLLEAARRFVAEFPAEATQYREQVYFADRSLGDLLIEDGRYADAEEPYRQALEVARQLAADAPGVADHRLKQVFSLESRAFCLVHLGRTAEAEQPFREALDLSRQLAREGPTAAEYRVHVCLGYRFLSDVLTGDSARRPEAEQAARQALDVYRQLAADFPDAADRRRDVPISPTSLVRLLLHVGRLEEAEQTYRQSIPVVEKLAAKSPDESSYRRRLAADHLGLGDVLWQAGRSEEAGGEYRRALETEPDWEEVRWKLAWFLSNCPEARSRDPGRAIELVKTAGAQLPDKGHAVKTLGLAYYRAGDWDRAVAGLTATGRAGSYEAFPRAMAHWRRGDKEEARLWYKRGCWWMEEYKNGYSQEPGFYWEDEFRRLRAEAAEVLGIAKRN
jgi:serine/threonine protein kinase